MGTLKLVLRMILGTDYKKAPWDWNHHTVRTFTQYARLLLGSVIVLCIPFLFLAPVETISPFIMCSFIYILLNCICRVLRW